MMITPTQHKKYIFSYNNNNNNINKNGKVCSMPPIYGSNVWMDSPDPCSKYHDGPGPKALDSSPFGPMQSSPNIESMIPSTPPQQPQQQQYGNKNAYKINIMEPSTPQQFQNSYENRKAIVGRNLNNEAKGNRQGMPQIYGNNVWMDSPDPCSKFHDGPGPKVLDSPFPPSLESDSKTVQSATPQYYSHNGNRNIVMDSPDPCSKYHEGSGPKVMNSPFPLASCRGNSNIVDSPDPCSKFHDGPGPKVMNSPFPIALQSDCKLVDQNVSDTKGGYETKRSFRSTLSRHLENATRQVDIVDIVQSEDKNWEDQSSNTKSECKTPMNEKADITRHLWRNVNPQQPQQKRPQSTIPKAEFKGHMDSPYNIDSPDPNSKFHATRRNQDIDDENNKEISENNSLAFSTPCGKNTRVNEGTPTTPYVCPGTPLSPEPHCGDMNESLEIYKGPLTIFNIKDESSITRKETRSLVDDMMSAKIDMSLKPMPPKRRPISPASACMKENIPPPVNEAHYTIHDKENINPFDNNKQTFRQSHRRIVGR